MATATAGRRASIGVRSKGAETRARILEEAARAFAEHGAEGVVLRRIAATLGIQLGNLQYYFPNRQELLLELMRTEGARGLEPLQRDLDRGLAPEATLRRAARRFVESWRGQSGAIMNALGVFAQHDDAMRALRHDIYRDFYAALRPVVERIDPGRDAATVELRTRLVTALLDGAAMQVRVGSRSDYLDAVADHVVAIARGAGAAPSP